MGAAREAIVFAFLEFLPGQRLSLHFWSLSPGGVCLCIVFGVPARWCLSLDFGSFIQTSQLSSFSTSHICLTS